MRARLRRAWRWALPASLSIVAVPGPCSTFDDSERPVSLPSSDGGRDSADAGREPRAYLSLEAAVRACARMAECPTLAYSTLLSLGVPLSTGHFVECVDFLASPIPPSRRGFELQRGVLEAIAGSRGCAEALSSLPYELLVGNDPRCSQGVGGCLNPTSAVACNADSGFGSVHRCSVDQGGPTCVSRAVPEAGTYGVCTAGACVDAGGVPEATCNGTVLSSCDPRSTRLRTSFDCAWMGLACGRNAAGDLFPTCITALGADRACSNFSDTQCDGNDLLACVAFPDLRWTVFSCGELGASCRGGGRGLMAHCRPPGAECSPDDPEFAPARVCSRDEAKLCVNGKRVAFDCASIGKVCDPKAGACQGG